MHWEPWEKRLFKLWLLALTVGCTVDGAIMWVIYHWWGDPSPIVGFLIGIASVPLAGFFIITRGMKGHTP